MKMLVEAYLKQIGKERQAGEQDSKKWVTLFFCTKGFNLYLNVLKNNSR